MSEPAFSKPRGAAWKWWICGLLLLATMINYMDRLTLNQTIKRVMGEVGFGEKEYGDLESAFAYAFALGAILAGWMADRWNVRWLYPASLFAWSLAGFATGLVSEFRGLIVCRFLLGLCEAGHWPCALRTTQRILPPDERSMGNSILQSGAAIGAILTPLLILALPTGRGTWRYPFLIVGGVGATWVLLWMVSVRSADLKRPDSAPSSFPLFLLTGLGGLLIVKTLILGWQDGPAWLPLPASVVISMTGVGVVFWWLRSATNEDDGLPRSVFLRRFGVLAIVTVTINGMWHFFRAWLPLFLQQQHGYSEPDMNWFTLKYYVSTDIGSLTAGYVALRLVRGGVSVHRSRLLVFGVCAVLCTLALAAAHLPTGYLLSAVLLIIGFAALGLFPNYYSLSQELTTRHQGKVTGALGCCSWLAMAPLHETVGTLVKETQSYSLGMSLVGFAPLLGLLVLLMFWNRKTDIGTH